MLELLIIKRKEEKEILLIEKGKLIEYYIENEKNIRREGDIYLGIVNDILPGMEAAFVDIGADKKSYIQKIDVIPQVDQTKNVEKGAKKSDETEKSGKKGCENKNLEKDSITDYLKQKDKILVQVKKDSNKLKGARISTHLNIPSKYLALMPNTDIITVSQKIENVEERERLKKLVKENITKGNGAIIRTSAQGKEKEIIEDIKIVEKKWNEIKNKFEKYKKEKETKPHLIQKSEDIIQKLLMDLYNKNVIKIISNDKQEIEKIREFIGEQKEYSKIKTELKNTNDIKRMYDIENQVAKIAKRKIWLKCGGFITIEKTEALTAIDVNSGKLTEGKSFKDIVYKVNEEATKEIARQIRLRDIGGIIIIDYIDLRKEGDREKLEELLKEYLKQDRAKTQVEGFTKLDLMALTRKHICSHDFGEENK